MPNFETSLEKGIAGESYIASWLRARGNTVLPIYEKIIDTGKGPQLFLPKKELIAPDFFVFNNKKAQWIEAKHKTAFTWHRKSQKFCTGIDLRHYGDYLKVNKETPWEVWLLFLHDGGQAKDSPKSPRGLYGNSLDYLSTHENHRHSNWGKSGMVYWAIDSLKLLAQARNIVQNSEIIIPKPDGKLFCGPSVPGNLF